MGSVSIPAQSLEIQLNRSLLKLQQGDLTALEADALVFYAREDLQLGSGFGAAIQTRGGDSIKKELQAIGRVAVGEAAITRAGNMKAKHIIHACGPKFQEPDTETKLRDCVFAALRLASDRGLKTLLFPPLGAGFYGVPLPLCARVMVAALREFFERRPSTVEQVTICVIDRREFAAFEKEIELIRDERGAR